MISRLDLDLASPRRGEKASYYSAVCLETGEVEWMELEGNSNARTSAAFLTQLKERHPGPLNANWGWVRAEATGNLCLGSKAAVQQRVGNFLAGLVNRKEEVKRRCRTVLRSRPSYATPSPTTITQQMHISPWL